MWKYAAVIDTVCSSYTVSEYGESELHIVPGVVVGTKVASYSCSYILIGKHIKYALDMNDQEGICT